MNSLSFQPTQKFFKYQPQHSSKVANECSPAELTPTVLGALIIVVTVAKRWNFPEKTRKKDHLLLNINCRLARKTWILLVLGSTFISLHHVISQSPSATLSSPVTGSLIHIPVILCSLEGAIWVCFKSFCLAWLADWGPSCYSLLSCCLNYRWPRISCQRWILCLDGETSVVFGTELSFHLKMLFKQRRYGWLIFSMSHSSGLQLIFKCYGIYTLTP